MKFKIMSPPNEDVKVDELNFENSSLEVIEDVRLKSVLVQLETSFKENEQKQFIKEIVEICKSNEQDEINTEAIKCILDIFIKFSSKKVLKKHLQDVILKAELTDILIRSTIKEILETIKNNKSCNIKLCTDLLNFIYTMQNLSTFNFEAFIENLFPLYIAIYGGFVYQSKSNFEEISFQLEDLFAMVNVVLKQILSVFVKDISYIKRLLANCSLKLILLSHAVIVHEKIGFDIKTKAGLILTHSCQILSAKYLKKIVSKKQAECFKEIY